MDAKERLKQTERRAIWIGLSLSILLIGGISAFVAQRGGWMYLAGSGVFFGLAQAAQVVLFAVKQGERR